MRRPSAAGRYALLEAVRANIIKDFRIEFRRRFAVNVALSFAAITTLAVSLTAGGARLVVGAKDFWQNFPAELEREAQAFTFYAWPRHNPPADRNQPVPPGQAYRLAFAHEGECLDFRLPDAYVQDPIWSEATQNGREANWDKGRAESVNAQGIARTEELLLYLADADAPPEAVARVMQGLNDETLRAVVDPAWACASGVFGRIRHRDTAGFPEDERVFEEIARAPARWIERLEVYGKWIYGDLPINNADVEARTAHASRTYKKNHHGWPFK